MDPWEKQVAEEMAGLGSRMGFLPSDILLHIFDHLPPDYQLWLAHFRSEEEDEMESRFERCDKDDDEDLNDEFDVWHQDDRDQDDWGDWDDRDYWYDRDDPY